MYRPHDLAYSFIDWKESGFKSEITPSISGYLAGFWDCCALAVFCYTGNELLAVTAWETENPRRTLPKAVRRVSGRIILYYTSAIFFLGLTVSANDPLLRLPQNKNPRYEGGFIIMAKRAGIPVIPDIINIVMIIATFSVATADLYVTVWFQLLKYLIPDAEPMSFSDGICRIYGTEY